MKSKNKTFTYNIGGHFVTFAFAHVVWYLSYGAVDKVDIHLSDGKKITIHQTDAINFAVRYTYWLNED